MDRNASHQADSKHAYCLVKSARGEWTRVEISLKVLSK